LKGDQQTAPVPAPYETGQGKTIPIVIWC